MKALPLLALALALSSPGGVQAGRPIGAHSGAHGDAVRRPHGHPHGHPNSYNAQRARRANAGAGPVGPHADARPRESGPHAPTPGPLTDAASATLEEFILRSDVIARVSLLSVTAKGKTVPSGEGVAPTYQPMQELRFRVLQGGYLKGSGGSEITVEVLDILGHTYLTESEALVAAQSWLADRSTTWDDREAVVFLERHTSTAPNYRFTKALAYGTDYAVDSLNPAWLPVDTAPAGAGPRSPQSRRTRCS